MDLVHIIDTLIGIVVMGGAWFVSGMTKEQKRIEILLNRTREEYVTRSEVREDMSRVMEALHRVEDKLDRVLQKDQQMADLTGKTGDALSEELVKEQTEQSEQTALTASQETVPATLTANTNELLTDNNVKMAAVSAPVPSSLSSALYDQSAPTTQAANTYQAAATTAPQNMAAAQGTANPNYPVPNGSVDEFHTGRSATSPVGCATSTKSKCYHAAAWTWCKFDGCSGDGSSCNRVRH